MSSHWEKIKTKCYSIEEIKSLSKKWKEKEYIVFTNGCFDILHPGHINYLSKAAELGTKLIVGLNSDKSVSKIKGPSRPYNNQNERQLMLASLEFVDAVVIFEQETPLELIKTIVPNFLVKGGDYSIQEIVGNQFVSENGGEVLTLEFIKGHSTSSLIEKIKNGKN